MTLNHADSHILITRVAFEQHAVMWNSVSDVQDLTQKPPDHPCFNHQALGVVIAGGASALPIPLSEALNFLFTVYPVQ